MPSIVDLVKLQAVGEINWKMNATGYLVLNVV